MYCSLPERFTPAKWHPHISLCLSSLPETRRKKKIFLINLFIFCNCCFSSLLLSHCPSGGQVTSLFLLPCDISADISCWDIVWSRTEPRQVEVPGWRVEDTQWREKCSARSRSRRVRVLRRWGFRITFRKGEGKSWELLLFNRGQATSALCLLIERVSDRVF